MKTKNTNQQVELSFELDSEGNTNRGWQVDKISALIDGKEVGYLKLAFIPMQRFVDYYPTIFNWMDQFRGQLIMPRPDRKNVSNDDYKKASSRHYKTFNEYELRKFINRLTVYTRRDGKELDQLDHSQLLTLAKEYEKKLLSGSEGKEFKKFKTYYVNKPIDDYISVFDGYRREGIAEYLYTVGVKWLESRDLPFYLSTIRQPAAEALAEKMRNKGYIRKMSNKRERFIPEKVTVDG